MEFINSLKSKKALYCFCFNAGCLKEDSTEDDCT